MGGAVHDDDDHHDDDELKQIGIGAMVSSWTREVERIAFATFEQGNRIVGLTAPGRGAGVSRVARQLASIVAKSGKPVLLADFSLAPASGLESLPWQPGREIPEAAILRDEEGFDRLVACFDDGSRFLFNNVERLKQTLREDLARYEAIVVDLGEVPSRDDERLNGTAVATACDTVLVVALTGRVTQPALDSTLETLASAGASVGGLVLNERFSPTLGAELAREARRLLRIAPRLAHRLERYFLNSKFLNLRST